MGCPAVFMEINHKLLLGLYSPGKALSDIENSRLCKLVERAMRFRFVKGKENSTPDAFSQFPSEEEEAAVSGIMGKALDKDNCAAGWMVLAGWNFDATSDEEIEEAKTLELEMAVACKKHVVFHGYRG